MKVVFNRYMIYLSFLFAIKQLLLKIKSEVVILEKVKSYFYRYIYLYDIMRHDECHEQEENLVLRVMKTKLSDIE